MKAALGALVVAVGLCVAVMIRADESPSPVVSGPVVQPLARPADRQAKLEYPDSVLGAVDKPAAAATQAAATPPSPDLFSKFRGAASKTEAPKKEAAAETNRPLRFPAVFAAKPSLPATDTENSGVSFAAQQQADGTSGAAANNTTANNTAVNSTVATSTPPNTLPTTKEKSSLWRPVQAAFKQITGPGSSGSPPPAPPSTRTLPPVPQVAPPADAAPTISGDDPAQGTSSVKIEARPPWRTAPTQIEPHMHPSQIIMADGSALPPDVVSGYLGGPQIPKSQCGYCSPAPAFGCCTCQSVKDGGPGCNCGSNGVCATCGGSCSGKHGGCKGGCGGGGCGGEGECGGGQPSNWVNGNGVGISGTPAYGSCVLERFACCLCRPWPDCSNGCVDFCHSWIFHEDCHWCTSNHKCCNPGCPDYPHGGCSNGTSGGCGCGCAQCVPPPDLYFTADALILTRNNESFDQPLVTQTGTGDTLLSTQDMTFAYEVGPSITLGYRPTPWDAWEISYFGLMDWDTRRSLTGAGDLNLPGALGTALDLNFANADRMNLTYSSIIHNGEFNYLWTHGQIMWLLGFRYFHLGEELDINSANLLGATQYTTTTRNDLYGGQLGARYRAGWKRFNWDFFGKAGVYGNRALEQQFISNVGGTPIRDTSVEHGNTAFVGDIGVNASYNIGKCWTIRAGYNAIWVEDVALAPNQLDFSDTPTSGNTLNTNGSVFLHGAHAGIGCHW